MVVFYHWLPSIEFFHTIQLGPLGVSVFFVLSGFLITRILITNKDSISNGQSTLGKSLKTFYLRRSIRIFPIYYLLLAFLFLLNFETIRDEILWHSLYAGNILYVIKGEFSNGLSHLWSLCVEEQFYLMWPLFLFLIPQKFLKQFFIVSIIMGVFMHLGLIHLFSKGSLLVFARIDAFAWGGLLAYLFHSNRNWYELVKRFRWVFFLILILFSGLHFFDLGAFAPIKNNLFYILCFFVIAELVNGVPGVVGRILETRALIFIGKISYGIYLYHNLMQWLVPYFSDQLGIPFPNQNQEFVRFVIYLIITLIVASLSWFIIEKPLSKFKNKKLI